MDEREIVDSREQSLMTMAMVLSSPFSPSGRFADWRLATQSIIGFWSFYLVTVLLRGLLGPEAASTIWPRVINAGIGLGFEEERAYELLGPFHELHRLRNKVVSHAQGSEAREIIGEIKRSHPGIPEHFRGLVAALDASLTIMAEALKQ